MYDREDERRLAGGLTIANLRESDGGGPLDAQLLHLRKGRAVDGNHSEMLRSGFRRVMKTDIVAGGVSLKEVGRGSSSAWLFLSLPRNKRSSFTIHYERKRKETKE